MDARSAPDVIVSQARVTAVPAFPVVACEKKNRAKSVASDKFLREGRSGGRLHNATFPLPTSIATFRPSYPFLPFLLRARVCLPLVLFLPSVSFSCLFFFFFFFRDVTSYRYLIKGCPIIFFYHACRRSLVRYVR